MSLRNDLIQILRLYTTAKREPKIRSELEQLFHSLKAHLVSSPPLKNRDRTIWVDACFGSEQLANIPTVVFVDEREYKSALSNVFCALLFKADMTGIYLALCQELGVSQDRIPTLKHLEDLEKTTARLRHFFLFQTLAQQHGFSIDDSINLGDMNIGGKAYEKATIAYKFYPTNRIPSDWEIENDLDNILSTYENYVDTPQRQISQTQFDIPQAVQVEEQSNVERERITSVDTSEKILEEVSKTLKMINYQKAEKKFHILDPPKMQRVRDIIASVENKWQLPNFQRYFDWEPEDVREFLESVFNDYYVGSFLLWEKAAHTEPDLELINIDGVRETIKDPSAIILDGQQRITSLYWAIRGPRVDSKPRKVPPKYFYIDFKSFFAMAGADVLPADKSDLVSCLDEKYNREETIQRLLFPLYELEDYQSWINMAEDFLDSHQSQMGLSHEKIRAIRIIMNDRLRHIWDGYEIPCVFLPASIKLGQVAKIFEQLNTKGKVLGIFDLLMARLLKYHVHLRSYWDECLTRYPNTIGRYSKKYGKIPVYLVQSISLYLDKSARSASRDDILDIHERLFRDNSYSFSKYWNDLAFHMDWAINNVENQVAGFGVKDEKEAPSVTMITMSTALHKEIEERSDKANCYSKMDMWYWASVFTNAYSGAVDSTMSSHYKELMAWFDDEKKTASVVEQARRQIDFLDLTRIRSHSNAIYKGVLSLLYLEQARDFAEKKEVGHATLYQKHHIFPKGSNRVALSSFVDSILNITWITRTTNQRIVKAKKPSIYLRALLDEKYNGNEKELLAVLKTHFIDKTCYESMLQDEFEKFILHRQGLIKEKIKEKIGLEVFGKEPVLIKPDDPWQNKINYESAIANCTGIIKIIDRYFSIQGLKFLTNTVDSKRVTEIRILTSVNFQSGKSALENAVELRNSFKEFQASMKTRGIIAELRILLPDLRRISHDRWMLSDTKCYRVPSPDTVVLGQFSEISEAKPDIPFDEWWNKCPDIIDSWNTIRDLADRSDKNRFQY